MIAARRRQESARLVKRYTIRHGGRFRLSDVDPNDTASISSKEHAAPLLADGLVRLQSEQEKLYAQGTWAVLLVFQAMDAAGKDSTIKHVMSGVNPQGCQVFSFKAPTREELAHDFLWRTTRCCRNAAALAFSTVRITKKCSSSACIPSCWRRSSCRRRWSRSTSGRNASTTSTHTNGTCRPTASRSASSSCTYPARNRRNGFWSALTLRQRTGSSRPGMSPN